MDYPGLCGIHHQDSLFELKLVEVVHKLLLFFGCCQVQQELGIFFFGMKSGHLGIGLKFMDFMDTGLEKFDQWMKPENRFGKLHENQVQCMEF